jgi:hypothetical protein
VVTSCCSAMRPVDGRPREYDLLLGQIVIDETYTIVHFPLRRAKSFKSSALPVEAKQRQYREENSRQVNAFVIYPFFAFAD